MNNDAFTYRHFYALKVAPLDRYKERERARRVPTPPILDLFYFAFFCLIAHSDAAVSVATTFVIAHCKMHNTARGIMLLFIVQVRYYCIFTCTSSLHSSLSAGNGLFNATRNIIYSFFPLVAWAESAQLRGEMLPLASSRNVNHLCLEREKQTGMGASVFDR